MNFVAIITILAGVVDDTERGSTPVGAIAGGLVAGICACGVIGTGIGICYYCIKKKKRKGV